MKRILIIGWALIMVLSVDAQPHPGPAPRPRGGPAFHHYHHGGEIAGGIAVGIVAGAVLHDIFTPPPPPYPYPSYALVPAPRPRPNLMVGGALVGGVAGAVIGHNNGRHGWEGAVIGAGAGLVVGGVAECLVRRPYWYAPQPQPVAQTTVYQTTTVTTSQQQVAATAQAYPGSSSMAPANALFGR